MCGRLAVMRNGLSSHRPRSAPQQAGGRDRGGHPPGPPLLSPSLDAAPQLAVEVDVEAHGQTERNCGLLRL